MQFDLPYTSGLKQRYIELKSQIAYLSALPVHEAINTLYPPDEEWAIPFQEIVSEVLEDDDVELKSIHDLIHTEIIQPETPTDVPFIRIMSLYSSKGLEADLVIISTCIQGLIPRMRDESLPPNEQMLQEEEQRRLFYVALTRSKQELVLSTVAIIPLKLAKENKMSSSMQIIPPSGYADSNKREFLQRVFTSNFITNDLGNSVPDMVLGEKWSY